MIPETIKMTPAQRNKLRQQAATLMKQALTLLQMSTHNVTAKRQIEESKERLDWSAATERIYTKKAAKKRRTKKHAS